MKLFSRTTLAQAFKLPLWGQIADETPPQWLVSRIQREELVINRLGGFTMHTPWGVQQCAAGDIVVLFQDDSIGFEKPEGFANDYEPVTSEDLLKAA